MCVGVWCSGFFATARPGFVWWFGAALTGEAGGGGGWCGAGGVGIGLDHMCFINIRLAQESPRCWGVRGASAVCVTACLIMRTV